MALVENLIAEHQLDSLGPQAIITSQDSVFYSVFLCNLAPFCFSNLFSHLVLTIHTFIYFSYLSFWKEFIILKQIKQINTLHIK